MNYYLKLLEIHKNFSWGPFFLDKHGEPEIIFKVLPLMNHFRPGMYNYISILPSKSSSYEN